MLAPPSLAERIACDPAQRSRDRTRARTRLLTRGESCPEEQEWRCPPAAGVALRRRWNCANGASRSEAGNGTRVRGQFTVAAPLGRLRKCAGSCIASRLSLVFAIDSCAFVKRREASARVLLGQPRIGELTGAPVATCAVRHNRQIRSL
jgi:hypothetical protein